MLWLQEARCGSCARLDSAFAVPEVAREAERFVGARVDLASPMGRELTRALHVQGRPVLVLFDAAGVEVRCLRSVATPASLAAELHRVRCRSTPGGISGWIARGPRIRS